MARTMVALAMVIATTAPGLASTQPPPMTLHYDVRYGFLTILSMDTTIDLDATSYRSRTRMQTDGVIAALFPWKAEAESSGERNGTTLAPRRHEANGEYRGERRRVRIDYAADGTVTTVVEPAPEDDARDRVPPELQRATIDPITASLAAASRPCEGSLPVFDGRRRYDMRFQDMGPSEVESARRALYTGPARRCRATIVAHAGFWQTDPRASEVPTTLDYWIAAPRPDVGPVPVYLELAGARGTLAIHLTRVEPLSITSAPAAAR